MFPEDTGTVVKEVKVEFLCYKFGGFEEFLKWSGKTTIEMRYIFYGPVFAASVTKSWFKISEDDKASQIYKERRLNNRSNLKIVTFVCESV